MQTGGNAKFKFKASYFRASSIWNFLMRYHAVCHHVISHKDVTNKAIIHKGDISQNTLMVRASLAIEDICHNNPLHINVTIIDTYVKIIIF